LNRRLAQALTAVFLSLAGAGAQASIAVISFVTPGTSGIWEGTLGFRFIAQRDLSVTSLGLYDEGQNGLAVEHAVGIFNNAGVLIANATVPAVSAPGGLFVYQTITPINLISGQTYTIAAEMKGSDPYKGSDKYNYAPSGFLADGAINFIGSVESPLTTLAALGSAFTPFLTTGQKGYFGPNFRYESATAVPEPGVLMLAGLGLAGFAVCRRSWRTRGVPG
jgi:hypothetical protein